MLFSENAAARWARPQGNHDGPERRASRPSQGRDSRVSCRKRGRQPPGPHLHIVSPIHGSKAGHTRTLGISGSQETTERTDSGAIQLWSHNARLAALLTFMLESKGQFYFFCFGLHSKTENSLLGTGFHLSKMQRTLALGSSDDCLT